MFRKLGVQDVAAYRTAEPGARTGLIVSGEPLRNLAERAAGEAEQAASMPFDFVPGGGWSAPLAAARHGDEAGQVAIAGFVHGEEGEVRRCVVPGRSAPDGELEADNRGDAVIASGLGPAHRAAQIVVVGERDGVHADGRSARDEGFGIGCAVEEREAAVTVELDVVTARRCARANRRLRIRAHWRLDVFASGHCQSSHPSRNHCPAALPR